MKPTVEKRLMTFEDFCSYVRDGQKADLIDGDISMASPDSLEGNKLNLWIARLMGAYVEEKELGDVFISRVAFRMDKHQGPEPDVAFVRKDRVHLGQVRYFGGPPDLAMELVSPESVERDYEKKRAQYQKAGVPEYWIIDETLEEVTLLRLEPDAKEYTRIGLEDGAYRSIVLPGFYLRPEWLWASPLPKKAPILATMLAP